MNAKERAIVREAIDDLMADECRFTEAVGKLCGLVGITYPAYDNLSKPFRAVDMFALLDEGRKKKAADTVTPKPVNSSEGK